METAPAKTIITIVVLITLALAGALFYQSHRGPDAPSNSTDTVCPQDALQCPDGSYVGRIGPDCEFATCPTSNPPTAGTIDNEATVCTMDAFQCPDGTWVGRTGPNCQFVCP